ALAATRVTPPPRPGSGRAPAAAVAVPRGSGPEPVAAPSNVELIVSSGEHIRVAGRGVIGRDPSETAGAYVHRIALTDTDKLLSRAHLEFGLEPDGQFWVSDLHSTNGAFLERPRQQPQRCLPGYRVVMQPGDLVSFGGRTLRIERH
ncbi:MAG TPA: FHA domain-containing protein, partial [Pseudolysinimonas sp.]|nr:FHA domain-containing protein [Pseudolysinimonas sp.]